MTCRSEKGAPLAAERHRRASAGFTLIELIVVLAIMGLVVALASPRLHRALPGAELAAGAEELAAALRRTRARAIAGGHRAALLIDIEAARYALAGGPGRRLPKGIEVEIRTAADALDPIARRAAMTFYADGTAAGGRIVLRRGTRAYRLDIDWLTGRITVAQYHEER